MVIFSEGSLARTKKFSPMVPSSVFRNPEAFRYLKMVAPSSALLYRSDATQGGFSIVTKYFALSELTDGYQVNGNVVDLNTQRDSRTSAKEIVRILMCPNVHSFLVTGPN